MVKINGGIAVVMIVLLCASAIAYSQVGAATAAEESGSKVISDIDLTEPFKTKTKWAFKITQHPDGCEQTWGDGCDDVYEVCFLHSSRRQCQEWGGIVVERVEILNPARSPVGPLLVTGTSPDTPSSGSGALSTTIWTYSRRADDFRVALALKSFRYTNGETRIITDGPLAGDVIQSAAGSHAPYRYRIVVYHPTKARRYLQILSYAGESKYGDGNSLAVIDAEMPEILKRLHQWKRGDALPVPARMRPDCKAPRLQNGLAWCDSRPDP